MLFGLHSNHHQDVEHNDKRTGESVYDDSDDEYIPKIRRNVCGFYRIKVIVTTRACGVECSVIHTRTNLTRQRLATLRYCILPFRWILLVVQR